MHVTKRVAMAVGATMCLTASIASAQTTSTSTETRQFEVIAVTGNDLVVRGPEGDRELRVPDDFRFTVDGTAVSVHELKPGMKGTATITTRTTMVPVTVTEIKEGTVAQVAASTIVVRTDEGLKSFTQSEVDNRGVRIIRDGKPALLSDFRPGDRLSATIITSLPPATVTESDIQANLHALGPEPPAAVPDPVAASPAPAAVGTSGSAPPQHAAQTLPKTAGPIPLMALAGLTALAIGAALTARRRRLAR
jgi:hypothetical protein